MSAYSLIVVGIAIYVIGGISGAGIYSYLSPDKPCGKCGTQKP